jgi:predicted RNA-binding Zn ribbon-like protein
MTVLNNPRSRHQRLNPTFPRLLGDRLCLDFANSIEDPATDHAHDFLRSYPDLVAWGQHAGVLTAAQSGPLLRAASQRPDDAAATLARALDLREAIDQLFHAIARGESPVSTDLETVQQSYIDALSHAALEENEEQFTWTWSDRPDALDAILWPVARSAVELLTQGDLRRVKECPLPEGCSWLFYDQSKNASRRWCSMEGCGTLVKMRRYHARCRTARTGTTGT